MSKINTDLAFSDPALIPPTPAKSAAGAANGGNAHVPSATPSSASSSSTSSRPAASGKRNKCNYRVLHYE